MREQASSVIETQQPARGLEDGVAADLGTTPEGWYGAVLFRPDVDDAYRDPSAAIWSGQPDTLRPGASLADWQEALAQSTARIGLLREGAAEHEPQILAEAAHLTSPAVALSAPQPVVAWAERVSGQWRLRVFDGEIARTAIEGAQPLGRPAVAWTERGWLVAAQRHERGGPRVIVCDAQGGGPWTFGPARNPHLVASGQTWVLAFEALTDEGTEIRTVHGQGTNLGEPLALPRADDLNLVPQLATDGSATYLVHEGSPMWGFDEQLGLHRDLYLWRFDASAGAWAPAEHTANARLPIPRWATREVRDKNFPPIQPLCRIVRGQPTVFFRRYCQHGGKAFGWDVMQLRRAENGWHAPQRISASYGHPEKPVGVLPDQDGGLLAMGGFTQLPLTRYEPGLEGPSDCVTGCEHGQSNHPGRPYDLHLTLRRWRNEDAQCESNVVPGTQGRYLFSPSIPDIAPEPPALSVEGKTLLWADLHVHSSYSKCAAPTDGTPEENLRFQRDRLNCSVLCLTEHTHLMSRAEIEHSFDVLEREAGEDAIALYASEPLENGQDTNFYSLDRDVIRRFTALCQTARDRATLYRLIHEHLPEGTLIAARHFHAGGSRCAPDAAADVRGLDPALEPFMEAQQHRGDNLLMPDPCGPATVRHFLHAGCRLGLVGGTDHSNGAGPDHLGLTGLWVDALTPEAVWRALWQRHTFSVNNGKIALWATLNDAILGEALTTSAPVRAQVQASCPFPLRRVFLQRDGEIVAEQSVEGTTAHCELVDEQPIPGPHWYVVSAEACSRFMHQPAVAHLSPFFVEVQ